MAHTIESMLGWSLSIGKIFGVQVRLHSFFLFLLFLSVTWASFLDRPLLRGVALWLLVLLAVAIREMTRAVGAVWFSIDVKSILLLPTGGILTYATPEDLARAGEPRAQRWMALLGPLANLTFGLTVAALVLTVAPSVDLLAMRWVTPMHLLRAMVWLNLLLAAVNLLPAWPLDAGRVMRGEVMRNEMERDETGRNAVARSRTGLAGRLTRRSADSTAPSLGGTRTIARIGPVIAIALIVCGIVTANFWVIMAGMAILLGAQLERQALTLEMTGDQVRVRDVMLTEYSILSASATLEDAIEQARHTLQDVFPVVRAGNMVGAVARQDVLSALGATGNGYVQGIMTRSFETAVPEDPVLVALGRVVGAAGVSSQLVPVIEGDRIVGILTPQNLQRSMRMVRGLLGSGLGRGGPSDAKSSDERE